MTISEQTVEDAKRIVYDIMGPPRPFQSLRDTQVEQMLIALTARNIALEAELIALKRQLGLTPKGE